MRTQVQLKFLTGDDWLSVKRHHSLSSENEPSWANQYNLRQQNHPDPHTRYDLATYPEYAEPLREEAAYVECDDWTKAAIEKMDKIDNLLRINETLHNLGM